LNFIATFQVPNTPAAEGAPYLPSGPFHNWSSQDKAVVPGQITQVCQALWAMQHDNPATRILPNKQPSSDEEALGVYLCLAGHMPSDWPDREKVIISLRGIFQRAKELGSDLISPVNLQ
jgi:hypothetical protein